MNETIYAGFWRRAVAYLLDLVVIQIFAALLVKAALGIYGVGTDEISGTSLQMIAGFATFSVLVGYECVGLTLWGSTLGRKVVGVKVVSAASLMPPTLTKVLVRILGRMLSGFLMMLGFLMVAFDAKKRALHDHLAGTICIRERPSRRD